jgi:poly(beta-D-mannuronate) lyase
MKTRFHLALFAVAVWAALCGGALRAREFTVKTNDQLKSALDRAGAGDVVILTKGGWNDADIVVSKGGRLGSPVVIRAEVPGETILSGSSSLEINAPYVTVDGLFFQAGSVTKQAVILFNSDHGVVKNTAIADYNPPSFETGYYWVFFNGESNTLDRCYFKGKNNRQPLIGNAIEQSRRHLITRCYFKNIPHAEANGREIIRVWGAGKFGPNDKDGAYFTIAENLFDHADGEGTEIVSLKSNHNKLLNNTVIATRGCLNIRRGNFNIVQGNIILGQGAEGAQGLRMSGERNLIQGNYVSGTEYGIQASTGEFIKTALTPAYKPDIKGKSGEEERIAAYPQNKDVTISDNVTFDVAGADLEMGGGYKKHWPEAQLVLLPENCTVKNNRFVRPKGGDSITGTTPDKAGPLARFAFKPNAYSGNVLAGGKNTFAPAASGVRAQPLPSGWTEARERAAFKPLTAKDVGPAWVIALREAGKFLIESPPESGAAKGRQKKPKNS